MCRRDRLDEQALYTSSVIVVRRPAELNGLAFVTMGLWLVKYFFWPKREIVMPGAVANAPEKSEYSKDWQFTIVSNVSKPTLEVFRAKTKGPMGFVLICPGGSYEILAYDLEGTEIAEALNKFGVSAGVLKYRVPGNRDGALMDAQRAIRLARANAKKWNIDPDKIGIMGFSAGASLSARASTAGAPKYEAVDETDKQPFKPNLTGLIYPAYCDQTTYAQSMRLPAEQATDYNGIYKLAEELKITNETPPVFIVEAQDDPYVNASLAYYMAMKKAGRTAGMHLFSHTDSGCARPPASPSKTQKK